jgi:DNA-binding CsgD family transcriptional regulator
MLLDRTGECQVLDRLIAGVQAGESGALVLRGEAGFGKTALLEFLAQRASGCRIVRASGTESEMELPFAGVHQLCASMLDQVDRLPVPQRDALSTAFGLRAGNPPDRFLVALAVLSLLAEAARARPLVCIVDDAQWLDRASAQVLAFVARRLMAESVAMIFAVRDLPTAEPAEVPELAGLAELPITGLPDGDARSLLMSSYRGPFDARVVARVLDEARGNPLALLELPHGLAAAQLAGGFALPDTSPLTSRIEFSFLARLEPLPPQTRQLLLAAAAEPTGDVPLLLRAAQRLGIASHAAAPAEAAGLIELGTTVRFRHPLLRSAIYGSARRSERQVVHAALADATDARLDPDRRAWHRAHAAPGAEEDVAAELEHSAGRARARGGLAAAAAFLERAAALTPDPAHRVGRAISAAQAKIQAGAFDAAADLLAMAEAGPLTELQEARVDLLRAQLAFLTNRGRDAVSLLLTAAKRLAPIDVDLSRATHLDALSAAIFVGLLADRGGGVLEVARAARSAPRLVRAPSARDLLLDGLAVNFTEGYAAGLPILRQALATFGNDMSADEELHWMWLACVAALHLWDDERWDTLSVRYVELARAAGALSELPLALNMRTYVLLFAGELTAAASLVDEVQTVTEATGGTPAPYAALGVAALRGSDAGVSVLIEATIKDAIRRGEGVGVAVAERTNAVLSNGLGHYREAMAAARRALNYHQRAEVRYPGVANWAAAELIEAAACSGMGGAATETLAWLAKMTSASRTSWALGIEARSRALLSDDDSAAPLYEEAIDRLGRTRARTDLARTRLLYGEWLRRQGRPNDSREKLRAAHEMFTGMGAEAFAERARRELAAIGDPVRKRAVEPVRILTVQESQIAQLVREGLSNAEIGARLFISTRTVEWHLSKIFAKLRITSRRQLRRLTP